MIQVGFGEAGFEFTDPWEETNGGHSQEAHPPAEQNGGAVEVAQEEW